jgi:hypothetical protein
VGEFPVHPLQLVDTYTHDYVDMELIGAQGRPIPSGRAHTQIGTAMKMDEIQQQLIRALDSLFDSSAVTVFARAGAFVSSSLPVHNPPREAQYQSDTRESR